MRELLRFGSVTALAILLWAPAAAAQGRDCHESAIATLRAAAPDGYAVYQHIKDRQFFLRWLSCEDTQLSLSTAVHESVHFITADADAFPLVGGGAIQRPHEVSAFFAPARIAKRFKSGDLVDTYLRPGQSSSGTDFLYLLDELNAYAHDLNAAVDLNRRQRAGEDVDNRDGLAAMMAFVAVYAETAEASEPATWSGLQQPQVARTIAGLWAQGERVMASSCGIPHFGTEDRAFIRAYCDGMASSALGTILGRPPICPVACLKPIPEATLASDEADTPAADHTDAAPTPRPFWSRLPRRRAAQSPAGEADTTE